MLQPTENLILCYNLSVPLWSLSGRVCVRECQSVTSHLGMCGKLRFGGALQGGGKKGTALIADGKLDGLWREGTHWATWQVLTNISSTKCQSWPFSLYSPRSFLKKEDLTSAPWSLWGIFSDHFTMSGSWVIQYLKGLDPLSWVPRGHLLFFMDSYQIPDHQHKCCLDVNDKCIEIRLILAVKSNLLSIMHSLTNTCSIVPPHSCKNRLCHLGFF